jgi:endonuclease III
LDDDRAPDDDTVRAAITTALLDLGERIEPAELFPSLVPEAADLVATDPYAFVLATCLDRQMPAQVIWTIPYDIKMKLGHLDPHLIDGMSNQELLDLVRSLPRKPRYISDAPTTIRDITRIVVAECGGDASRIWIGKTGQQIRETFRRVHGVGPGISSMAPLLIEKAFGIKFTDLDRPGLDVKADVHVMRVLYRLGMILTQTEAAALEATRQMYPAYPGGLDAPLWWIGRNRCHAVMPRCSICPMVSLCCRRGVTASN